MGPPARTPAGPLESDADANGAACGLDVDGAPHGEEPYIRLGGLADYVEAILRCRRIVFIACGTSYHACMAARATLEEFAAMPVVVELAGDFMVGAPAGGSTHWVACKH